MYASGESSSDGGETGMKTGSSHVPVTQRKYLSIVDAVSNVCGVEALVELGHDTEVNVTLPFCPFLIRKCL